MCVKGAPYSCAADFELQRLYEPQGLRYPQFFHLFLVGQEDLVLGLPVGSKEREAVTARACLEVKMDRDPFQLWQITKQGVLRNRAGYRLEVSDCRCRSWIDCRTVGWKVHHDGQYAHFEQAACTLFPAVVVKLMCGTAPSQVED